MGHRHRRIAELQAASVEWLCHQRAGARKEEVAIREDSRHIGRQYPLPGLVSGVHVERTHVHALYVGRAGAEVQKVFAVGEKRGPRVNELSLGQVDLRHRRRRAACRGYSPDRAP